jgi:hypothetical protein
MASLKEALATLATVPPKAFTRQRDALAARLREAGDTTTAAQVKARRVPTVPVWVVNRLALEQAKQARRALRERTTAARQQDIAVKHAPRALRSAARKTGP